MITPVVFDKRRVAGMWRLIRRFSRDRGDGIRGVAAIEFAIIATMLVFMTVKTADFGMGFYCKMQVQNAAQAGARYAMLKGPNSVGIDNATKGATKWATNCGGNIAAEPDVFFGCASATGVTRTYQNATCSDGSSAGRYVTVSTQATYSPILPFALLPGSYDFGAQSTVRVP